MQGSPMNSKETEVKKAELFPKQESTVDIQTSGTVSHYSLAAGIKSTQAFPDIAGLQILEKLGEGGMGIVYRAHQLKLQREVAVKMIKPGRFQPEARERFRQETEAIARIKHPGIVQVFDVGDYQGEPYCVLEYVSGGGLDQRIRESLPEPRISARLVEQLADAMSEVHRMQIVHRDLKPANILIQGERDQTLESCQLKISDFGLAKFLGDSESDLTQTGYALGTPNYMSPEQASGQAKHVTETTDVYSIGAILYHLLTGQAPFRGNTVPETLKQVLEHEPTPPSRYQPRIPRDLEAICLRCLEKKKEHRYKSAIDLAGELRRFQAGEPTQARPLSGGERVWRWIVRHPLQSALGAAAVLVFILALAGAGITKLWLTAEEARGLAVDAQKQEEIARLNLAQVTYFRQVDLAYRDWREGNVSRSKKLLADCDRNLRQWEWWHIANLCQNESMSFVARSPYVQGLSLSADGKNLLTSDDQGIIRYWDCKTGAELYRFEKPGDQFWDVTFLPDRKHFAVNSSQGKMLVYNLETKKCVQEIADAKMGKMYGLAVNKQGDLIAAGDSKGQIFVWSLSNAEQPVGKMLFQAQLSTVKNVYGITFHPDNERLVVADNNMLRTFHIKSQKEVGTPLRTQMELWKMSFDSKGQFLAFGNETGQLEVIHFDSRHSVMRTGAHPTRIWHSVFHPKYPLIATGSMDQKIKIWDLNTANVVVVLRGHVDDVTHLQFDSQGELLYSAAGKEAKAWNWRHSSEGRVVASNVDAVKLLPIKSEHDTCLTLLDSQFASVRNNSRNISLIGNEQPFSCFAGTDKSNELIVGRSDGSVETVSALDAKAIRSWKVSSTPIVQIAFVPSRQWIITLDRDNVLQAWDTINNKRLWTINVDKVHFPLLSLSDSGNWVATLASDFQIAIWDLETGRLERHLKGHVHLINSLTTSPDGKTLLSTSSDFSTRIWDIATGALAKTLISQPNWILCSAYSPDGKRIVTGSLDNVIKLWDVASGAEVMTLQGHAKSVRALAFTTDGQGLYSSGEDGTIRFWPASHQIKLPETVNYELNPSKE